MLASLCKHLLPRAGAHVRRVVLLDRIDLQHDIAGSIKVLKLSQPAASKPREKETEAELPHPPSR